MATRGECVAQLKGLLRRSDCSDALALTFLGQGMSRIQRLLRVPSMERVSFTNADTAPIQSFEVPTDLLQIIDILANNLPLEKLAYRVMLTRAFPGVPGASGWCVGQPASYARIGSSISMLPVLATGGQVMVLYYGTFEDLATDASTNSATIGFPDLCVYAGLAFAGDYFRHDSTDAWEGRFQTLLTETQDQATQLDATGGSEAVQSAYGDT